MSPRNSLSVRKMFGRIVPRYDLVNRLMSLGMDGRWRRVAVGSVRPAGALALDIGAGTGDIALELARRGARRVVAADFSAPMLAAAVLKARGTRVEFAQGDALRLPLGDGTFDVVTNGFLLRNLADLPAGLSEMARVLRPGGRLACLDMTQPPHSLYGGLYRVYFDRLVPVVAGAISGDFAAYRYLPHSLRGFPDAETLAEMLREAGLVRVRIRLLAGGVVALHTAVKPG